MGNKIRKVRMLFNKKKVKKMNKNYQIISNKIWDIMGKNKSMKKTYLKSLEIMVQKKLTRANHKLSKKY